MELIIIVGALMAVFFMMIATFAINNYASFPSDKERIEQLRIIARLVPIDGSSDIFGKVAAVNGEICSMQKYLTIWWAAWAVPDGWRNIDLISIHR